MGNSDKFLLLLWKNYLIQRRKILVTILEIALPTFFGLILVLIRLRVSGEPVPDGRNWSDCTDIHRIPFGLPKRLAYSPRTPITSEVMNKVSRHLGVEDKHLGFMTEDDMVSFLLFANSTVNNTRDYLGGIVFTNAILENGTVLSNDVSYKIRLSSFPRNGGSISNLNPLKQDTQWFTQFMFPLYQTIGPRENDSDCGGVPGYKKEGFLALQNGINKALFEIFMGKNRSRDELNDLRIRLHRHPFPPYNDDRFVLVIQQQFPLVLILSFVLVALNIVKDIVHEKERKLKESMKMMGLNNWLHWMAWFVKYLLFLLITVAVLTLFLTLSTAEGRVIGLTDPSIVFVFLLLYAVSTITFCFAISVFFSKANSGAAAGGIIFFLSYIPYLFLQPRYATMSLGEKIASSVVSNIAMSYGGQIIGMFEGTGSGIQWSTIGEGASVDDNFSMLHVMIMLVIDSVLYFIFAWYVEGVFPGEYGVPQKWYFPLTKSYWCGTMANDDVPDDKRICIGQNPDYFEKDPVGIRAGIRIRNLRKQFGRGEDRKVAVAGMSLDMYEGQITAVLGHNGAGKTTTMSMLTGFLPPTSGTAFVNGFDIRDDIASVRESLGLCPQHDVLFDTLTVEEHLKFFAKLKGCPSDTVSWEVEETLESINLVDKRKAQSKTLSGGMKRKLSVGIALIGGSKVVILDEPSSGLDPDARRQIWTVLQNNRNNRTIILTTHFMDEADLLGDRIAIMAEGVVKCCGSSLFLKNKYGAGYHMVIVKDSTCDVGKMTDVVNSYVPQAQLESNIGAEVSYILPHESSEKFEGLFTDLESNKSMYGICSYGASVTTMEEVFLRVGESSDHTIRDKLKNQHKVYDQENVLFDLSVNVGTNNAPNMSLGISRHIKYNPAGWLLLQQFYAMFLKRAKHTFRNKLISATQIFIPLLFTVMALIVVKTFPGPQDSPSLTLTVDGFGDNTIVYSVLDPSSRNFSALGDFYATQFSSSQDKVAYINNEPGNESNPNIDDYLFSKGKESLGLYNLHYIVGAELKQSANSTSFNTTAYFNNQAYHSPAISLATLANGLFRYFTNSTMYSLTTINHPLPRTQQQKVREETEGSTTGFTISFNFVFGMAFLSSSFVLFLIKERSTKAKHIQFVSGVRPLNFWASTFCWDMINFMIPCGILIVVLWLFDIKAYYEDDHAAHLILLFILFGWASLPFMYLLSFLFNVPSTGFVWLTMFNILAGDATILAVGILSIPELGLKDLADVLEWIFLTFLPNYCLGQGLSDYYENWEFLNVCQEFTQFCPIFDNPCCGPTTGRCGDEGCIYFNSNYLGWEKNGIGRMLVFLFAQGILYFTILLIIEYRVLQRFFMFLFRRRNGSSSMKLMNQDERSPLLDESHSYPGLQRSYSSYQHVQEDSDVAWERARLANTPECDLVATDSLILKEVTKYYGNNLAVNHMSVGIPDGECFGLLGINGAGKTTTFKMLTGDESISSGEAYLDGNNIRSEISAVRQRLGYCPQYDALIDQMTGRETLVMFSRLRGVVENLIPDIVDGLLTSLLLMEHADKQVKAYSGGNKRKLSTAIALVGNPKVIFLDEPTTGMDPVARRYLWDALCQVRSMGRTLVLTSHSMEECEALCTRLAIMVNGEFKCLGSPQHLKNKFGQGYTLLSRVAYPPSGEAPNLGPLMSFIEQKLPGSELKDIHQGMVHYHIKDTSLSWAKIFGLMEGAKKEFHIEDYSVSQTTLEQVFINFARAQRPQ